MVKNANICCSQITLIKGLIFELSVVHDYGYFQTKFYVLLRVFGFVSIKSIVFFFLATTVIMKMFNFQFWVKIKIDSWYYLKCCTSLLFSHFLMYCFKSSCFRTVELHANQLIVIVFSFDYAHRFDIGLFQFIVLLIKWGKMFFLNVLSTLTLYSEIYRYT